MRQPTATRNDRAERMGHAPAEGLPHHFVIPKERAGALRLTATEGPALLCDSRPSFTQACVNREEHSLNLWDERSYPALQRLLRNPLLICYGGTKHAPAAARRQNLAQRLPGSPSHAASAWIGVVERWETASGKSRVRFSGRQEFRMKTRVPSRDCTSRVAPQKRNNAPPRSPPPGISAYLFSILCRQSIHNT